MEGKCSVSAFLRENPIVEQFGDIVEGMRKGEERLQS